MPKEGEAVMAHLILAESFETVNTKLREVINVKLKFEIRSLSHIVDALKRES